MARQKFTAAEKLRGLRKELANPKTPKQFRESLRKQIAKLER